MKKKKSQFTEGELTKDGAYLSLEGGLYFVSVENGKIKEKEEIDPHVILELVKHALREGLDSLEKKNAKA